MTPHEGTDAGERAERRALAYLRSRGHTLLARNYLVRGGELDLVTRDGDTVVFTEVRHRARATHGTSVESVTPEKLRRVRRAALTWLLREHGRDDVPCRIDVIGILGDPERGELTHVENVTG
ncbi:YraN family protein [Deinococcus pimensis]|uniref:YraN family protein n=1 Tax=Deinococcus pimensis TaxID=309888 RepID=UPI0004AE1389|nr:YraN family protein [Deinococcus pimensis]